MIDLPNDGSVVTERIRFEMTQRANELRKNGKPEEALPLYRELAKNGADPYSAAGLLHCLRKLRLFDEALSLCTPANPRHMVLDWYRSEVIWTLIQGKLRTMDDSAPVSEVLSAAECVFR